MHLVEIEMVRLEAAEALFAGAPDVQSRQARLIGPGAHAAEDFRGEHHLLPPAAALGTPSPDDLFRDPFAHFPAVDVGRIEEVDAEVERPIHDGEAVRFGRVRAEVHGAQTEPADFQARAAEMHVLHGAVIVR